MEEDEWKTITGLRVERKEPCALTYDEYGHITILSGIPDKDFWEETKRNAKEYAEVCEKSRGDMLIAQMELAKYSQSTDYMKGYAYSALIILILILINIVLFRIY